MPIIKGQDFSRRRPIPAGIKMLLMIAVIAGLYVRSCWNKTKEKYFEISNIEIVESTSQSVDIAFRMANPTENPTKESVPIKVYTSTGEVIASKISRVNLQPGTNKRYLKVLDKFKRPLQENETIEKATVEYYKPSIL